SAAMKRPFGAKPAGSFTRSKYWIAASLKSECAVFGPRATTNSSGNNLRFLGTQYQLCESNSNVRTYANKNGGMPCSRTRELRCERRAPDYRIDAVTPE